MFSSKLRAADAAGFFEAPCNGPLRGSAAAACSAGAGFLRRRVSPQISFLCVNRSRDGLSTRAHTQEIPGAVVRTTLPEIRGDSVAERRKDEVSVEENSCDDETAFTNLQNSGVPLAGDIIHTGSLASHRGDAASTTLRVVHLRLDDLDMQRDFRGRPVRRLLDVDSPAPLNPAKPGKSQNVPPKAREMILKLRTLPVEDFPPALRRLKCFNPERADWLYVLRYFKEKEDKSMLLEVFKFALLQPSFETSARDYTNLIRVFVQLRNHEAVERTLKEMVEREVFPDLVTFTVVIGMYGKLGNLDMVKSKFNQLKLYGLVPDTIIYCALIEAYSQLGYAREAESFIDVMEAAGLPLKIEIFISLIRGYGNIGQVGDAERVFQLMQAKLFYPERRCYAALMDAYTKDEDVERAIEVFNNMISVGIEPTDKALARLMTACEKKNMLREAMGIMDTLESKSLKLGTNMLISFRSWLAKLKLDKEVKEMSVELEKRLKRKMLLAKKWNAYLPPSYSP